ncbi:hypothetical protein [Mucilaginibacter sp.]|uniref:hypothetical protein n=1 Tax=Mucilaginibacter sp. TaxID=1882438 RepID=UPI003D11DAE7
MRRRFYRGRFILIPLAAVAFMALTGFVVMNLWNALLPAIIHVGAITFWQAIGIFVLCKILFGFGKGGGHRMGGGAPWMRRKMEERFKHMSPEEKEMFKARMKDNMCNPRGWGRHGRDKFESYWDNPKPEAEKAAE